MYQKNLYLIPPTRGKTFFVVPEIIRRESANHKTIYWFSDKNNIEYCRVKDCGIISVNANNANEYHSFQQQNIYQIICNEGTSAKKIQELVLAFAEDTDATVILDSAALLLGTEVTPLLAGRLAADIHFLYDSMDQVYNCISKNIPEKVEYREKKFLDGCKKEYHTYEKNRIFWMNNRGVTKVKRKKGDPSDTPLTQPLPTYQPNEIFGCRLYPYKIGSMPGMTIEEILEEVKRKNIDI